MKTLKAVLLLSVLWVAENVAASPSYEEVRTLYRQAAVEEKSCRRLINLLHPYNPKNNPLLSGYKACATMMLAKYTLNPMDKLANFSEGRTLLENAVAADTKSVELRFLRFSVQTKAPAFLGYSKDIEADKSVLLKAAGSLEDEKLKALIVSFLKDSEYLTPIEKKCIVQ